MNEIKILIEEYFLMNKGEFIKNHQEEIIISNNLLILKLKYKSLKHIVESRKEDKYTIEKLFNLFIDIENIIKNKNYIINNSKKNSENDFYLIEIVKDKKVGVFLILELIKTFNNNFYLKSAFYRSTSKIKKILKQK